MVPETISEYIENLLFLESTELTENIESMILNNEIYIFKNLKFHI